MTENFSTALAEYQRCRAAELAIPPANTFEEEEAQAASNMALYAATTAALLDLLAIPSPHHRGIGEKLKAVADSYDLTAPGLDRFVFNRLMAEVLGAFGLEGEGLTENPKSLSERLDDFRIRTIEMNKGNRSQEEWDRWSKNRKALMAEVLALPRTSENVAVRAKAVMLAHIGEEELESVVDACPCLSGEIVRQIIHDLAGERASA